jgi:pimeloyl-ACP methyl ester carboxylesterase
MPAARVPLVLLPAVLCDADLYNAQIAALADLAEPLVLTAAEADLAKSAQRVLERAPARFALAGTSAGGNLALEVLAAAPSRVIGLWLTGVNPGSHGDPTGARRRSERVRAGEFDVVVQELAARCIYASGPRATEALATVRRMARGFGPEAFLRWNDALIARPDRRGVLAAFRAVTLLLWGRHDAFVSAARAAALAVEIPAAQLVVLEDSGHFPTLEQPDEATRAVRAWLSSVVRNSSAKNQLPGRDDPFAL